MLAVNPKLLHLVEERLVVYAEERGGLFAIPSGTVQSRKNRFGFGLLLTLCHFLQCRHHRGSQHSGRLRAWGNRRLGFRPELRPETKVGSNRHGIVKRQVLSHDIFKLTHIARPSVT